MLRPFNSREFAFLVRATSADYQTHATRGAILSCQQAPGSGCKELSHIPVVSNAHGPQLRRTADMSAVRLEALDTLLYSQRNTRAAMEQPMQVNREKHMSTVVATKMDFAMVVQCGGTGLGFGANAAPSLRHRPVGTQCCRRHRTENRRMNGSRVESATIAQTGYCR
jgi:hypothetical protein